MAREDRKYVFITFFPFYAPLRLWEHIQNWNLSVVIVLLLNNRTMAFLDTFYREYSRLQHDQSL